MTQVDIRQGPSGPLAEIGLNSDAISNESTVEGETVTDALNTLATGPAPNQWIIRDDFDAQYPLTPISIAGASGTLGAVLETSSGSWGVSGNGSASFVQGENNHPGIVRLTTTGAVGGIRIHKGRTITDTIVHGSNFRRWEWHVRINDTVSTQVNVGLTTNHLGGPASFILTQFNPSSSPNLVGFCGDSIGSPTFASLDFLTAPGTGFITLAAEYDGSAVEFFLAGLSKGRITTHIPSALVLNPFAEIFSSVGSRSVDLDLCEYNGLPSR